MTATANYEHAALLYRSTEEYAAGIAAFLEPAVAAGNPAVVAVPPAGHDRLRHALDRFDGAIERVDMQALGRNPARITAAIGDWVARSAPHELSFVGEPIWSGRSAAEVREATRHEALIDAAFAGRPLRVLCPYDATVLPTDVLTDARITHSHLIDGGERVPSEEHRPGAIPGSCEVPLEGPPAHATFVEFDLGGLARVRQEVAWAARTLPANRASDMVIAANELAANSVQHAGGRGSLAVWDEPGGVVCEVADGGEISDPLAGRRRVESAVAAGRGIWLVHQLCDLVEVRTGSGGTRTRIRIEH